MTPLWTIRDIFYLLPRRKVFHPQSLTWNPKNDGFKKKNSFRWVGYVQVSHEKWAPGCLGCIGDDTTQYSPVVWGF